VSTGALITLIAAWSIVGSFTVRFFLKVLKNPHMKEGEE